MRTEQSTLSDEVMGRLAEDAERKEYDSYRENADGSATLADLFHAKDNS